MWPLAALLLLAALVRFPTLGRQSLWYDEAVTALRVLHPSLSATTSAVAHVENTPPLYYLLLWASTRVLGTSVIALRCISAAAGVGLVAVAWAIGRELGSRRAAVVLAAIVAVNPLFVWYSQEARAYELFALLGALSFLFFLRARRAPVPGNLVGWAACSALALLSHYFALFLVVPEAALLLRREWRNRRVLAAVAAVAAAGAALLPLARAQGGHGTGWITNWPLGSRIEAIAQYYLLGESGRPLGRTVLVLAALPILAALPLARRLSARERSAAGAALVVAGFAVLAPVALALLGVDYLAPRYLIAAFVPLSAVFALLLAAGRGTIGAILAALLCAASLLVLAVVVRRPQLQRGDWRGVADVLGSTSSPADRAVVVAVIGALPLQYYEPGLTQLAHTQRVRVREIDLVGYPPLRHDATKPPARGFALVSRTSTGGIDVLRFRSAAPRAVSVRRLLAERPVAVESEALSAGATYR
jgi:4-amino-4-deoxy-L-arabinose transferase-like glycosyltransferase